VEEAAALWESLAQSHPYFDVNKRAAFAITYTFLTINGAHITADADEIFSFIDELNQIRSFHLASLLAWLRANTEPA
jgi:death-on-curing protein